MTILKFKFILLSFVFISFLGCKTQSSTLKSQTNYSLSNDYFLVIRGDGKDDNIALENNTGKTLKYFFADSSGVFQMNYNVIPSVDTANYEQGYREILSKIEQISSQLDSDSTFILYIDAHGNENGYFSTSSGSINAEDIITALKKGRIKNEETKTLKDPFKRFIIMMSSCFSKEFVYQLQNLEESRNQSLFKEGIYIYSADSLLVSTAIDWKLLAPMIFLLRANQYVECNKNNFDYTVTPVDEVFNFLEKHQFTKDLNELPSHRIKKITKLSTEHFKDETSKILDNTSIKELYSKKDPKFYTLVSIIDELNKQYNRTMGIDFSDEYNTETLGSIRTTSIFPKLECD